MLDDSETSQSVFPSAARNLAGRTERPCSSNPQLYRTNAITFYEDLILSRIFRLRGLEDGLNRGGKVDTWNRMIYIHGTNHEDQLVRPASHGCIRLSSRDVIDLFRYVRVGDRVLISDG
jgi:hypothetical protein